MGDLMMDPLTLSLVVPAAAAGASALTRHGRLRRHTHRALAEHREALIAGREPRLAGLPDPEALRAGFERDRILRVEALLAHESLAELRQECEANGSRSILWLRAACWKGAPSRSGSISARRRR